MAVIRPPALSPYVEHGEAHIWSYHKFLNILIVEFNIICFFFCILGILFCTFKHVSLQEFIGFTRLPMVLREQKQKVEKTIATGEKAECMGTEAGHSADLVLEAGNIFFCLMLLVF